MSACAHANREALDAGACGFSAQLLGEDSVQRDYDGTPMITDTMSADDLKAFATVLREAGRGCMQIAGGPFGLTEQLAEVSGQPVVYNVIAAFADQHGQLGEGHKIKIRQLEEANQRKGLRVFGQAVTTDISFSFSLEEWNLFDANPLVGVVGLVRHVRA